MAESRVRICEAITCKHNKDRKCMLSNITIDSKGRCEQFTGLEMQHNKPVDYSKYLESFSSGWKGQLRGGQESEEEKEYMHPHSPHKEVEKP